MAIYLDVIWLLNFLFDSLLLCATGLILKRKIIFWKVLIGGGIGSLLIFAPFTSIPHLLSSPFIKLLISIIMVVIAFGYKRLRYFLTNLSMFYLCTFAVGGTLIGIHYFLQFDYQLNQSILLSSVKGFGDPISWLLVIFGFPLALYFSRKNFDKTENINIQYDKLVCVHIFLKGKQVELVGLVDSGNQLYDPISKKPVMIVSLNKTSYLFPNSMLSLLKNTEELFLMKTTIPEDWMDKISIIPYSVVGRENQLLAAIKPDKVLLQNEEGMHSIKQLLIAFVDQQLSTDDSYDCIVHPKMMTQMSKEEVS